MSDKPISDYTDALEARIAELEAENERLRGALEDHVEWLEGSCPHGWGCGDRGGEDGCSCGVEDATDKLTAALTPPTEEQRMTVSTCFPCLGAGRHDLGGGISSKCAACAGTGLQGPTAEPKDCCKRASVTIGGKCVKCRWDAAGDADE